MKYNILLGLNSMPSSKSEIKVSFIVPFYGVEKYIEDCIKSLINQNMPEMEIILIDDCSPDGSLAIAEKYAKLDNRIKIIKHTVNKRQGGARNTGLAAAKGEYIWFIDSDDYIVNDPNILTNLYNQAKEVNADWLMFGGFCNTKGATKTLSSVKNSFNLLNDKYVFSTYASITNFLINNRTSIAVWRHFYKKSFLQENNCTFPENTTSEDYVSPLWLTKAKVSIYTSKPYYVYRKRANSTTTTKIKKNQYKDNLTMILAVASLVDAKSWVSMYLGNKSLMELLLYQHPLIKEFSRSGEEHKKQMVDDMAKTLAKISHVFNSTYFDEAIAFGGINFPKKYSKEDLKELVNALKNTANQDNLKAILYKSYTKLNKDSKLKKFFRDIQNKFK